MWTMSLPAHAPHLTCITMRALIHDGNTVSLTTNHPPPKPLPGEAVIRPSRVAISALDRQTAQSPHPHRGVIGHEFVGIVQSVNGTDPNKLTGKRVVASIATICSECDLCLRGLSAHCRARTLMGLQNRDGCFADAFTLPLRNLIPVPDNLDDDHAVFAHTLASAIQAARQLTIEGKPYITVLGDGPLGLLTVQLMAKLNASVRLIGKHPAKFSLCEKWGIKHRHIDDIGRRADQDVVVDCTGSPQGLSLALKLVRPRGKVLLKSLHSTAKPFDTNPIVANEIELIGSHFGPVSEAITTLTNHEVDVLSLITRRVNFNQAQAAWQTAHAPDCIKVLMEL